jgi:hypothetical protein
LHDKLTANINIDITVLGCRKNHSYFRQETKYYCKEAEGRLEKDYPIKVAYTTVWKAKQRAMK